METTFLKGPFSIKTSFKYLKTEYLELVKSDSKPIRKQAEEVLALFAKYPVFETGFETEEQLFKYKGAIEELMVYLFPPSLTKNEIKAAIFPFSKTIFYESERLKAIKKHNNSELEVETSFGVDDTILNSMAYPVILNKYYKYDIDFRRPTYAKITTESGEERTYRAAYNVDYLEITPTEKAVEITNEILDELLANPDVDEVWDKYFPEGSWILEGFGIVNMLDVTIDENISSLKEHLISPADEHSWSKVVGSIQQIFNNAELDIGVSLVDKSLTSLFPVYDPSIKSLILGENQKLDCGTFACEFVHTSLFKNKMEVVLPNVEAYDKMHNSNPLSRSLLSKGILSAVFLPILWEGELLAIMEIGSHKKNELNAINAVKILDFIPFIQSYAKRSADEAENQIEAIIQQECTSLHKSVVWKFENEAKRFIEEQKHGGAPNFNEVVFENVHPLFGQIDISGSSNARNLAIQKDLELQLVESIAIFEEIADKKSLPFYEQLMFEAHKHLKAVNKDFHSNSEQQISTFFEEEVLPVFEYLKKSRLNSNRLTKFLNDIEQETNSIYKERRNYDNTVDQINKRLGKYMDQRQVEAQSIFPHYFEKYKTDGIEHNLYIGQSIAEDLVYHPTILLNLRLWQLQVMCEMEQLFYSFQNELPLPLNVASLILAHDSPLSIRYRIDEKQFDVDGAYNVRYELVKKRIDKANIKGTDERLTQVGKMVIVYSNPSIEREYRKYLEFLQAKGYIGKKIEVVELENLQGLSGLKAIRADINYDVKTQNQVFTYEDLVKET